MYGKKRIGIAKKRTSRINNYGQYVGGKQIFIGGERSFQTVGFITSAAALPRNPFGDGFDVLYLSGKYIGTAATHKEAKIIMFNAVRLHPESLDLDDWAIDENAQLYRIKEEAA